MVPALLLLLFTLPALQPPAKETLPGARNVTRVDATIMCGGATTPEAFAELKKLGFISVINLRRDAEPGADIPAAEAAAKSIGLKYIHIPVDAANPSNEAAEAFLKAVTDPGNQPMYVHCGSGNRVGAMWLIKRVVIDGWSIERATGEARTIGLTNPALEKFAVDYASSRKR